MKNLSYIFIGIIIGALATYFFCPRVEKDDPIKIVKPKGVISVEKAKELNANWTLYRKAAVDSAAQKQGRKQDDRSVSWTLEDIQNYLTYAQNQSDSLGYSMTGVRIYLGVYGDNAGQTKKNLSTMFIVPTGAKNKAQAGIVNLNLQGGEGDIPVPPLNNAGGGQSGYPK